MLQKIKNIFHLLQAVVAIVYFRFPSKYIKVIGITGTDGKTTTTHLLFHILKNAGFAVSMISTIFAQIGEETFETGLHTTTPSSWTIQKLLRKAVDAHQDFFVLETTSHALDQNRTWGILYEVGIITNITKEHLDYHKTYENYIKTKAKLLNQSKISVINRNDASYAIIKRMKSQSKIYTFGSKGADFKWNPKTKTSMVGEFNKQNALAAIGACTILGLDESVIFDTIKSFNLPLGRLDIVYDEVFKVVIDFAHTPHALSNALLTVSQIYKKGNGRIIHVFGSAGLRDQQKRENMGKASAEFANISIITEEDHRTEDVEKICRQIALGFEQSGFTEVLQGELLQSKKDHVFCIIPNRNKAIDTAIRLARKGDVVIATGKSNEKSLARGKKEHSWDEYRAIEEALQRRNPGSQS